MTIPQAIEYITEMFPKVGGTLIAIELDLAQKEFVNATGILTTGSLLTSISTKTSFALPADCIRVQRIDYFDSDGKIPDAVLLVHRIEGGYIKFDYPFDTITGIPGDIANIGLRYVKRPATITADSTAFEVPEEFHLAVISKVLRALHIRYPQLERRLPDNSVIPMVNQAAADEAFREYREGITNAKKYINLIDSTPINIQGYFFAGDKPYTTVKIPS